MAYPPTKVLQLGVNDTASTPGDYPDKVAQDQIESGNLATLDQSFASATGSYGCSSFYLSGSIIDNVTGGNAAAGFIGAEYNPLQDRIIRETVAFVAASGSNPAGFVQLDVQVQQGTVMPANFSSIYAGAANQPVISGSDGKFAPKHGGAHVSGSNTLWKAGTILRVMGQTTSGLQGGLGAMCGLTVNIFWKPTGSYGA